MTESTLNYADIKARYGRIRAIGIELNAVLAKYVSKEGIEATARKLGFWKKGSLVFESMDQSCVLFDQAIHGHFTNGRNAVDRYAAEHPPKVGSDREAVLAAMKQVFHSLFQVEGVVPGVGVHVHDGLRDRRYFLADVGFSKTGPTGAVVASRVLPFEDFITTAGAALPVDRQTRAKIARLPGLSGQKGTPGDIENMSREKAADLAATIIRLCLKANASQRVQYRGIDEGTRKDTAPAAKTTRVGRNEPCPCGSGRKYKKCCAE